MKVSSEFSRTPFFMKLSSRVMWQRLESAVMTRRPGLLTLSWHEMRCWSFMLMWLSARSSGLGLGDSSCDRRMKKCDMLYLMGTFIVPSRSSTRRRYT